MSGQVASEGELDALVLEYLRYTGLNRTVELLERECAENGRPVRTSASAHEARHLAGMKRLSTARTEMIDCFNEGHARQFFDLWTENVPPDVRNSDETAMKLEFYINLHFALFELKRSGGGILGEEEGISGFKKYLECRGAKLSQNAEFLQYYALPYIPDPRAHPSYRELFSDKWSPSLAARLDRFLMSSLPAMPTPQLVTLFRSASARGSGKQMEQRLVEMEKKSASYARKWSRVQSDYHRLLSITADLVDTLESSIKGEIIQPETFQRICACLFAEDVRRTTDFSRPGTASAMLRRSMAILEKKDSYQQNVNTLSQYGDSALHPAGKFAFNFARMKEDLISGSERTRALLLQALRWKLTKSSAADRDAMLAAYIQNDLLGSVKAGAIKQAFIDMLSGESNLLRQYTARLLNTFACLRDGRSYLAQNDELQLAIMTQLQSEISDPLTRDHILGCVQKMSLRRQLQTVMINEGLITWIVKSLSDISGISDYMLEYAIALLMNLSLRTAGKQHCLPIAQQVIEMLCSLLSKKKPEITPYVNGALVSIISIPEIRQIAREMGTEEKLKAAMKDDPETDKQLTHIIRELNSRDKPSLIESDDEEDDDDEDPEEMEEDLDLGEVLKLRPGEVAGGNLLAARYSDQSAAAAQRKKRQTDSASAVDDLLRRPTTPSHNKRYNASNERSQPTTNVDGYAMQGRQTSTPPRADIQRPPTRSGSRPNSASDKQTGQSSKQTKPSGPPRPDVLSNPDYLAAFGNRSKIARTPDPDPAGDGSMRGIRPSGSSDGLPQPRYSDSLPTPKPGSAELVQPPKTSEKKSTKYKTQTGGVSGGSPQNRQY